MKLNLNTILIVLAGLGVFAPDIASVAAWLATMHIVWLGTVVKALGLLAAFCSAAPLVVPRLRAFLALLGLATPPGAQAPWDPKRDNVVLRPSSTLPKVVPALVFLGASLFASATFAQSPTLGHCLLTNADGTCKLVVQPDLVKPVLDLNLKTGKVAGGIDIQALGACYGATWQPTAWYASGADFCFNLTGSQTAPTLIYPSVTLHLINYVSITGGPQCLDGTCQWHLLFGGNFGLGFGAGNAAEQRAKALAAPRS